MSRDLDLINRLRSYGLEVTEVQGWQTRGKDGVDFHVFVGHHTGGALKGVSPSLGVVINGRSDLVGPLCNVFGPREESKRVVLVAAGKANHAGVGHWGNYNSNYNAWGLEEEHSGGPNEPLSALRKERYCRVAAACLHGTSTSDLACMHLEWATPKGRKVDFIKSVFSPGEFRSRVDELLKNPKLPWPGESTPPPVLQKPQEEEDVLTIIQCHPSRDEWPEIKTALFKTNGLRSGTEWTPTTGHAAALHDGLKVAHNDADDIVYVSPNLLVELLSDEFYVWAGPTFGINKPTKLTHPKLNSPYLPES